MWDNGTSFPEPCIDRIADTVGKVRLSLYQKKRDMFKYVISTYFYFVYNQYEALAWLCGGLGFFASLGLMAVWNDKASKIPFVSFICELVPIKCCEWLLVLGYGIGNDSLLCCCKITMI